MIDKDTLMNLIDEYAEVRHINGCWVYNSKTASARQAVIEALSGVQALSAAPAVPNGDELRRIARSARTSASDDASPTEYVLAGWKAAMLAASPTPPAKQQATPKAAPTLPEGWTACTIEFGNNGPEEVAYGPQRMMTRLAKWLGKYFAQVIADAAPKAATVKACVCGEPQAPGTVHRVDGPCYVAAPQQEAQEPCQTCAAMARTAMMDQVSFDRKPDCYAIRQITDDEGVEEWEDIRTSPDVAREEARDMMATGRGEIYEVVPLWTTPQPAPAPLSDEQIDDLIAAKHFHEGYELTASVKVLINWYRLGLRDGERAHGITQKGGSDG